MTALLAATFLLLQFLFQVFATDGSGCELPSGYVTYPEYNASYKNHDECVPWAEAQDLCVAEGAHLAIITSVEQMKQIVNFTLLEAKIIMFIGFNRSEDTSPWIRVDNGLPATSIPWSNLTEEEDHNCAGIWRLRGGVISNADCDYDYPFVCEIPTAAGCTNPVSQQE